jgi:flagellar basal-body rod modification protein FlgD
MIKVGDSTYTPSTSKTTTKTSTSSSEETSGQFMSLLLAQLTNQNPLEPMDDTQMVSQMVSMNSLEELQKISKAMTTMSQTNQFLSATNLMDKTVSYTNDAKEKATGTVSGVSISDSKVYLTINDKQVELSKLISVTGTQTD